ncbi:hypothetical protein AWB75_06659 [Caballeronia catudaia]|uniref:Uncharacterized protein n=1 Tax=Caballeronia catudaia TaxID=1777136 RepID=A0A158DFF5_9BURK|nr:hypothetical protein AWB75_06659 [Caballeronia catudaia]
MAMGLFKHLNNFRAGDRVRRRISGLIHQYYVNGLIQK